MAPEKNSMSVPQTPARSTSTTTSPSVATGSATSCTSPLPGPVITNARMLPSNTTAPPVVLSCHDGTENPGSGRETESMSEHVSDSAEWQAVQGHAEKFAAVHLRDLFDSDPRRGERLTATVADLYVDYSKNLITDEVLAALFALAERARLRERIAAMFGGEH